MLALISPFGFLSPYAQGVFVSGGIFAIATIGLYVTITSGQVSVMHQALVGVGGYAAGVASVSLGFPLVVSLLFGLVAGAVVGAVVALLLREMNGMVLGVATIAIGQALSLIAANIPQLGGSLGYTGISLQTTLTWVVVILIIVMAGLSWLRHTHFGLALLAVGKEPAVAEALGMSSTFVRVWAFGVGGALAGISGGLQAHWLSIVEPTSLGFAYEALLFMYLIIGGVGSPWGALVGAVGVTWLLEALRFTGSARYWILGLVLVVVIILRPQGLIARKSLRADGQDAGGPPFSSSDRGPLGSALSHIRRDHFAHQRDQLVSAGQERASRALHAMGKGE
jgi:branched-chain amino acid transport system permease protein